MSHPLPPQAASRGRPLPVKVLIGSGLGRGIGRPSKRKGLQGRQT